jgi:sulfoxide reductase heme-binding subunit YedZ
MMLKILNNRWTLWLALSLPAIPLLADFIHDQRYYPEIMHRSGVIACQLLVVALAITPLRIIGRKFPGQFSLLLSTIVNWLMQRRRHLGVASCGYALIHTAFYFRRLQDVESILSEWGNPELLVGWLALFILILLAITSNDISVRRMKKRWKSLHRWIYPCAILSFAHWLWFDYDYRGIFLLFVPLLLLQIYRMIERPVGQPVSPGKITGQ